MNRLQLKIEIDRIQKAYPVLAYFMQCYWNRHHDDFYSDIAEAVRECAAGCPKHRLQNFIDETERAEQDSALRAIIDADDEYTDELASSWGGMILSEEKLQVVKAVARQCLETGHFLSEHQIQQRRFLAPKHLAEFEAMIEEMEAEDDGDGQP